MDFTNIRLFKVKGTTLKANGYVTINNVIEVKITIIEGKNGVFVSMPSEKFTNKEGRTSYARLVKFVGENAESLQNQLAAAVLEEFNKTEESPVQAPVKEASKASKTNIPF